MENWARYLINREPNCGNLIRILNIFSIFFCFVDFLIHYFVLITIASSIFTLIFCWLCCCCCLRWRRRRKLLDRRRRIRYQLLQEQGDDDDDGFQTSHQPKEKSKSKHRLFKKSMSK
jgi:hypothetical protein